MSREATNKLLEMVDEGLLDAKDLAGMCLKWLSEDDVEELAKANDLLVDEENFFVDLAENEPEEDTHCPYVLFAGTSQGNENPMSAWPDSEPAIKAGEDCIKAGYRYVEVVYMPEDDEDTNEVVWWAERLVEDSNNGKKI